MAVHFYAELIIRNCSTLALFFAVPALTALLYVEYRSWWSLWSLPGWYLSVCIIIFGS